MTTPINQLTQNDDTNNMMKGDDSNSQIVTEILQEIREDHNERLPSTQNLHMNELSQPDEPSTENNLSNQQMYLQTQNHHLERQFDPNVNMRASDILNYQNENQFNNHISNQIITNNDLDKSNLKTKIIQMIKEPTIVILSVLLINNMFTDTILKKYLPKIFGDMVKTNIKFGAQFLKAIVVGLMVFSIKFFM
tara:strand:+ start:340 stop:918 length:579 start_codon:yes stop_codon:yes gene_type:complete